MSDEILVSADGLWKRYGLPLSADLRRHLRRWHIFESYANRTELPWALQDISVEIKRGETFGIIGRNGSGKSTLLKILADVTPPTKGRKSVQGRVFPMVELNAGLHPELTGRENIYALAAVVGFSAPEVTARRKEIEDFCELGDWLDMPVRTYSSGMAARLGFAVAVHVDADILMIDEVLGVGDFMFQKKCFNRMEELRSEGVTTILVSHSPYQIERECDRAMMLENGRIEKFGPPKEVATYYFNTVRGAEQTADTKVDIAHPENRPGTGLLRFLGIKVLDDQNADVRDVRTGNSFTVQLDYECKEEIKRPALSIRFLDQQNTIVFVLSSIAGKEGIVLKKGEGSLSVHVPRLSLMPGLYTLYLRATDGVLLDIVTEAARIKVEADEQIVLESANQGFVHVPAEWQVG